jgi:succinate dehydrogenase / fumarate reductase flavoprotein subunit
LGYLMLDQVGMARDEAGLKDAIANIQRIRKDFWENVSVPGSANGINQSLEKAARVAEFLEFAEVMAFDALERAESCGGHFRLESQTEEGEAMRMDDQYSYVAAWQYNGEGQEPTCHKEGLSFQYVLPSQRSYK